MAGVVVLYNLKEDTQRHYNEHNDEVKWYSLHFFNIDLRRRPPHWRTLHTHTPTTQDVICDVSMELAVAQWIRASNIFRQLC